MDGLIKKTTQSSQLADDIERKIRRGELEASHKMPSFRDLSSAYDVSFQVVKSAITLLEQRGMVICEPRVGIYVNPRALTPVRKNLATLSTNTGGGANYADQLLAFSSTSLWADYCISRHQIPAGAELTTELNYELERLSSINIDCLLVFLPALREKDILKFRKMKFPVAFIGDFHEGVLSGVANQIVEDTGGRAKFFVDGASREGLRNVVMMANGSPERHYYIKVLSETGAKFAEELGIRYRYCQFCDHGCKGEEAFVSARSEAIASVVAQGGVPDGFLLESFARTDLFIEAFKRNGLRVPDDVKIITSFEIHPGTIYLKYDSSGFALKVQSLIDGLLAEPTRTLGRQVISGHIAANFFKVS